MDWGSVEARDRGDLRPSQPTPSPTEGPPRLRAAGSRGLLVPVLAALCGLAVVAGAALAGPWHAAPGGPVEIPTPDATPPEVTDLGEIMPIEPAGEPDGGFPLTLWLVIAALIALFFVLRAFLNRASLARGRTEGRFDPADGRIGEVEHETAEPDLPALRRGVAAARRILDGHADPQDAVIAAWLELEQAAASSGVERAPSDTPTEFTTAVLDATRADPAATRTLLGLYHRARFAPDAVLGPPEVAEALRSLERIAESWEER